MQTPKKPLLEPVQCILWYVKGTSDFWDSLWKESLMQDSFCNADYVGDISTRRSTTRYVLSLGLVVISWCGIKRQWTVSLSTTEVEYKAAALATQECEWLMQLMSNLK